MLILQIGTIAALPFYDIASVFGMYLDNFRGA